MCFRDFSSFQKKKKKKCILNCHDHSQKIQKGWLHEFAFIFLRCKRFSGFSAGRVFFAKPTVLAFVTPLGFQAYQTNVCIVTSATGSLYFDACVSNTTSKSVTFRNYRTDDCTGAATSTTTYVWLNGQCRFTSQLGVTGANYAKEACGSAASAVLLIAPSLFLLVLLAMF
jgi:hypothetical protein